MSIRKQVKLNLHFTQSRSYIDQYEPQLNLPDNI